MLQAFTRTFCGGYSRCSTNCIRTFLSPIYPYIQAKKAGSQHTLTYPKVSIRLCSMEKESPKLLESELEKEEECENDAEEIDGSAKEKTVTNLNLEDGKETEDVERYQYIDRGFTTEIFKIELGNFPPRTGYKQLQTFLRKLGLDPSKIKKPMSSFSVNARAYVNFRSEEDRQRALETLHGMTWKNRILTAKPARPAMDPLFLKRKREQEGEPDQKRARHMTPKERLWEAVCPLASTPYEEQLKLKEESMKMSLSTMAFLLSNPDVKPGPWVQENRSQYEGMICSMDAIKPSPSLQYRNKCEFTVGNEPQEEAGSLDKEENEEGAAKEEESEGGASARNEDGGVSEEAKVKVEKKKKVVVGFRTGSYKDEDFAVVSSESCPHVPNRMKELAKLAEIFLNQSPLEPFTSKTDTGYWKECAVRCYESNETMLTMMLHPQKLSPEAIGSVKASLIEFFTSGAGSKAPPTSLYFQLQGRKMRNCPPQYQHLLGDKYVHEDLLGMKFRIAPPSFFQVNTPGCGVLYDAIREAVGENGGKKQIIYDICCGTGTIGLYLAKMSPLREVVGIEIIPEAVEDARHNAELNGVTNARYICGKAEDVIQGELSKYMSRNMFGAADNGVGILDPPRDGVHADVIHAIRKCPLIKKLVYLACKPDSKGARNNMISLCKRKSNITKGEPFRPVRAIPVDMFPFTPQCELIIVLERMNG